eukprot:TRINITY_DN55816_c0_g1_i1.p2 TRINITY_DN55816_c0_g1~~TRINITY_DN55816_c0_g1_i1.p2  ORF type:complete len:156 (+),score=54.41 TRINITY_DN55816_c0_g1_i1:68-535(+)
MAKAEGGDGRAAAAAPAGAVAGAAAGQGDPLNDTPFEGIDFSKRPQPPSLSVADKLPAWNRFSKHLRAEENRTVFRTFVLHSIAMLVVPIAAFFIADDVLRTQLDWGKHDALTGGAFAALAGAQLVCVSYVIVACREEARDRKTKEREEAAKKTQ